MPTNLKRIIYEFEDGKTLCLSLEQWKQVWSFIGADDQDAYKRCLRFLADIPQCSREMYDGHYEASAKSLCPL